MAHTHTPENRNKTHRIKCQRVVMLLEIETKKKNKNKNNIEHAVFCQTFTFSSKKISTVNWTKYLSWTRTEKPFLHTISLQNGSNAWYHHTFRSSTLCGKVKFMEFRMACLIKLDWFWREKKKKNLRIKCV